jgi:hypothetical protein
LPECIHDYNAVNIHQNAQSIQQVALVKPADEKGDRLDELLDKLDTSLRKKRTGAWL